MNHVNVFFVAELKVKVMHKHNQHHHLAAYNHTLARILVQYASAVRFTLNYIMQLLVILKI